MHTERFPLLCVEGLRFDTIELAMCYAQRIADQHRHDIHVMQKDDAQSLWFSLQVATPNAFEPAP